MIGPKRFSRKEKLKIASDVLSLEKMLYDTFPKASVLCEERDERTEEHVMELEKYLYDMGIHERVKLIPAEQPFSQFSPQIRYSMFPGIGVGEEEEAKGLGLESVLSPEHLAHIRGVEHKYQVEMADFNERFGKIYIEQEDAYDSLLEKTMVEMLFRQDVIKDKVIFYFNEHKSKRLRRAAVDLRTGETYSEIRTVDIPCGKPISLWNRWKLRKEARDSDANLYVVSNAWKEMTAEEMLYHVKGGLQARYDSLHPVHARAREKKVLEKELGHNLEVVATLKEDVQRKGMFFVREGEKSFGWLHPYKDVPADIMDEFDTLMQAEHKYRN